ncbi:MAG: MBL fold metallo-hydrolase [Pseudomonadales bacterium]
MVRFLLRDMPSARVPAIPASHMLDRLAIDEQIRAAGNPSVTWLGHAAFIVRLGGRVVITDPFLGEVAGPHGIGPRRFVPPALRAHELPRADVIVISHNHYDHLDLHALAAYPWRAETQVLVPLGVSPLLKRAGFARVRELDWWEHWEDDDLVIRALPAVHFSGRGPFDRNRTLWASFSIAAGAEKVWFSGDTALGDVFAQVGEREGPFDLALVAIGAYEPAAIMQAVHANPEEGIRIAQLVRARRAVGMHWGSIMLTPENPFEAPVRFIAEAVRSGYGEDNAWILAVGETRSLSRDRA